MGVACELESVDKVRSVMLQPGVSSVPCEKEGESKVDEKKRLEGIEPSSTILCHRSSPMVLVEEASDWSRRALEEMDCKRGSTRVTDSLAKLVAKRSSKLKLAEVAKLC